MFIESRESYISEALEMLNSVRNDVKGEELFLKRLYFLYPTLHVESEILSDILSIVQESFKVPFHRIKVIGSSHQGFSYIDKSKEGKIRYRSEHSDVDLAIIDERLFLEIMTKSLVQTNLFQDRTHFKYPDCYQYYTKNISQGFIRPDSIPLIKEREEYQNFERDIKSEFDVKASIAIYLNEESFLIKLKKQLNQFKNIKEVKLYLESEKD